MQIEFLCLLYAQKYLNQIEIWDRKTNIFDSYCKNVEFNEITSII